MSALTPDQFVKMLQEKSKEVQGYADNKFPRMAGDTALRFINGNFRAQGWQGNGFGKWKPSKGGKGTTLVSSGEMRAANYYTTQIAQTTLRNNTPQAKVHNEGFKGTVTVKAHTRNSYSKSKVKTGMFTKKGNERTRTVTTKSGSAQVRSHSREVNIPKRQFMPITSNDSPVLMNAIGRNVGKDLQTIFKH